MKGVTIRCTGAAINCHLLYDAWRDTAPRSLSTRPLVTPSINSYIMSSGASKLRTGMAPRCSSPIRLDVSATSTSTRWSPRRSNSGKKPARNSLLSQDPA